MTALDKLGPHERTNVRRLALLELLSEPKTNDLNPVTGNIGISGALVVVGGKTHDTDGDSLDIDGSDTVARAVEIYDENLHNFRIARSTDQLSHSDDLDKTLLRLTSVNYYGVLFPKQWCNL